MKRQLVKCVFLFVFILMLFPGVGFSASSAVRDLPETYTAGSTFAVTVNVNPVPGASGLILTETLPAGWTVVSANPPVNKYIASTNSYKWLGFSSPFTLSYTVSVPSGTTGTYEISGLLHTSLDDVSVTGDQYITDYQPGTDVQIFLTAGWNLIALPVQPSVTYTAESFLNLLNSYGAQATEIDRWYNSTWQGYIAGYPFNNFNIEIGKGYFIKCGASATITITGTEITNTSISFANGWNLIGIPSGTYTAQGVLDKIRANAGNATEINRWINSTWDGHLDGLPFNNYNIDAWRGYFIRNTQSSVCDF